MVPAIMMIRQQPGNNSFFIIFPLYVTCAEHEKFNSSLLSLEEEPISA
jgi:hypothetical protein